MSEPTCRFYTKPVAVEAFQVTKEAVNKPSEYPRWLGEAVESGTVKDGNRWRKELAGHLYVDNECIPDGDWLIWRQGKVTTCTHDVFVATYEPDQGIDHDTNRVAEAIHTLTIGPDETLVIELPGGLCLSSAGRENLAETVRELTGRVPLILDHGSRLSKLNTQTQGDGAQG